MNFLSLFWPKAPFIYAYMLQQFEYNPGKFVAWAIKFPSLWRVQKRGKIHLTQRAKLMLAVSYAAWFLTLSAGVLLALFLNKPLLLLVCLLAPLISILMLAAVTGLLQSIVVNPRQNSVIAGAKAKLQTMKAQRIAVLGSYGKTTMKELLQTIIGEGKNIAVTPGNKNVLISHARWINQQLSGDEEVLVFEYGEAAPGDIAHLAAFSQPHLAVVTGLAPAHLDAYPSLEAIADDFADINKMVTPENTFVQGNSELLKSKVKGSYYDVTGLDDWKVTDTSVDFTGTNFSLSNGNKTLRLKTGLLGLHQIGPITAVVAIASRLGLTEEQIIKGVAATQAFEHRMQPRHLGGAWIIDDTYNGTIEGMRAGLELLKILPGQKKIYVTPGLVDQGSETNKIHNELGRLIAHAQPDKVVLMQNSVTEHIRAGIEEGKYQGETVIETNPLAYYTNLEHFLAAGDVVLLQNDWPDSYT